MIPQLVDCRNGGKPNKRCLNGGMLEWSHVTITTVIASVDSTGPGRSKGVTYKLFCAVS